MRYKGTVLFVVIVYFFNLFFLSSAQASYLKAQSFWLSSNLKKIVIYKDSKKGTKLSIVAGNAGLYVLDITDPYYIIKRQFIDFLPKPDQIRDLFLDLYDNKKPLLWVADGAGGLCKIPVSSNGLRKPYCQDFDGFVNHIWSLGGIIIVSYGSKIELLDVSSKEWLLLDSIDFEAQVKDLYFYLVNPDFLASISSQADTNSTQEIYFIGYLIVANDWKGLQGFKLNKIVTYDNQQNGNVSISESYFLEPAFSWDNDYVKKLAGYKNILSIITKSGNIKIFNIDSSGVASQLEISAIGMVNDIFLTSYNDRYFLFVSAGRKGLIVYEISLKDKTFFELSKTIIASDVTFAFVDQDFRFYFIDRQAGLFAGTFPSFISLKIETNGDSCLDY